MLKLICSKLSEINDFIMYEMTYRHLQDPYEIFLYTGKNLNYVIRDH